MQSVNVLTINEGHENGHDLIKVTEYARSYFPTETWDDIRYLGSLNWKHDIEVQTNGESLGAFLLENLTKLIGKIKDSHKFMPLLLGITPDPIIAMYYFFDGKHFKRALYLVHDYVTEMVGVVSLYQLNKGSSSKVLAHGLGHSRGLRHHSQPIDLMYSELLRTPTLQVEGFCKVCLNKLTKNETNK